MNGVSLIGWFSSLVLLATLLVQIKKQWKEKTCKGVSHWLFLGQVLSSAGFVTYSIAVGDKVFIATNIVLLITNVFGVYLNFRFRKRA